jgi:hypothetical protein
VTDSRNLTYSTISSMMPIAGQDGWRSTELDRIYSVESHHVEHGAALGKPAHYAPSAGKLCRLVLRPGLIRELSGIDSIYYLGL